MAINPIDSARGWSFGEPIYDDEDVMIQPFQTDDGYFLVHDGGDMVALSSVAVEKAQDGFEGYVHEDSVDVIQEGDGVRFETIAGDSLYVPDPTVLDPIL